jgi:hypothetical protein
MLVAVLGQLMMDILLLGWVVTRWIFMLKVVVAMVNGVSNHPLAYYKVQSGLQMVFQILEAVEAEAKVEVLVLPMVKDQVMVVQES